MNKSGKHRAGRSRAACLLAVLLIFVSYASVLPACSSENGAVTKVQEDLYLIQKSETAGNQLTSVRELASREAGADLDRFLSNVRNFSYEVTGSENHEYGDEHYTTVSVRIRTYDFGSEYLSAWNDYLRSHEDYGTDVAASEGDAAETKADAAENSLTADPEEMEEFYDSLFARLAEVKDKNYIRDVDIIAIDPVDSGEWITNIKSNEELQDALFGGMISEMKALAGE